MSYFAELDERKVVVRVVVAETAEWCAQNLGGTWAETADPYDVRPQAIKYCGPGFGYDPEFPEAFAPQWVQPTAAEDAYPKDTLVFDEGRIWKCLSDANVWKPGVSGWRDTPQDNSTPIWVQPTGAHDAYPRSFVVTHKGLTWMNTGSDANVWEPGVFGWTQA